MPTLVSMFVYIDTASDVKRRAFKGSVPSSLMRWSRSSESLMYDEEMNVNFFIL